MYNVAAPTEIRERLRCSLNDSDPAVVLPLLAFLSEQLLAELVAYEANVVDSFQQAADMDPEFKRRQGMLRLLAPTPRALTGVGKDHPETFLQAVADFVDSLLLELMAPQLKDIIKAACYEVDEGIGEPLCGELEVSVYDRN